jgi:hypothetical protein
MEEPPMKRLIALALTVFALAAVPVAFGDNGSTPPDGSAPAATQGQAAPTQDQAQGQRGHRLELLRLRIQLVELRFAKHCGASATGADQRCVDFATKVEARLTKLDSNVQARIAKIQQTCSAATTAAGSTDGKCKNAAERIALLQKIDERVNALAQKVQDWLDGKTTVAPSTSSTSDSALDQAAAGLGKLTQQVGANG